MEIDDIVRALHNKRVRITDHADEEALADRLSFDEIAYSVVRGEVLEAYPADRPYPSCLIIWRHSRWRPRPQRLGIQSGHGVRGTDHGLQTRPGALD